MKCDNCPLKGDPDKVCKAELPDWGFVCSVEDISFKIWLDNANAELNKEPSLAAKIGSLATAVKEHALSGFENASPEVVELRQSICNDCPFFNKKKNKCKKCGCKLEGAKIEMASSKCPMKFWPA